jgi:hypothetical protein
VPGALNRGTGQRHWSEGVSVLPKMPVIVYVRHGAAQQVSDLIVHTSAGHVPVLGHGHPGVPEMVRTDPRREARVVD